MKEKSKNEYVKRTQKGYSMSFKLQVVQEVDFWMQSIEETIGKAKKEVGEERARQYEEEGIAMGF